MVVLFRCSKSRGDGLILKYNSFHVGNTYNVEKPYFTVLCRLIGIN